MKEKYDEIDKSTNAIFTEEINRTELERVIDIDIVVDNKQKQIFKIQSSSPLMKKKTGIDVFIILNEEIFQGLPIDQQKMVATEALTCIVYDFEKEKLIINKPDFNTFMGVIKRFGSDERVKLEESIKSLYDQKKMKEEELKRNSKGQNINQ